MILTKSLEVPAHIVGGLTNGTFDLFGGTVRVASGQPGAGQIVTLLRDGATGDTSQLLSLATPGIAAVASAATLGVSAVGFAVLSAKLRRIERDLKGVHDLVQKTHADIDRTIVANLDAACKLLQKAERTERPETSDFLVRSIDRFVEASSIYQQRLDATEDSERDLLDQYFKALALSYAGEMTGHYMRGDWTEVLAASKGAAEVMGAIQERLISLALVNHPDFRACMNAKRSMDTPDGDLSDSIGPSDCEQNAESDSRSAGNGASRLPNADSLDRLDELIGLASHLEFCQAYLRVGADRVPFQNLYLMVKTLEPNLTQADLIDLLRPIPRKPKSAHGLGALEEIKMQQLVELRENRWFGLDYDEDVPVALASIAERGLTAVLIGNAVRSYSAQYQALCDADLPRPKLLEMLADTDVAAEAYLVNSDYLNAA